MMKEIMMWALEKGQFLGQTEKEILEYLEEHGYEYEHTPESDEDYGYITIGGNGYAYSDHYEILIYEDKCKKK